MADQDLVAALRQGAQVVRAQGAGGRVRNLLDLGISAERGLRALSLEPALLLIPGTASLNWVIQANLVFSSLRALNIGTPDQRERYRALLLAGPQEWVFQDPAAAAATAQIAVTGYLAAGSAAAAAAAAAAGASVGGARTRSEMGESGDSGGGFAGRFEHQQSRGADAAAAGGGGSQPITITIKPYLGRLETYVMGSSSSSSGQSAPAYLPLDDAVNVVTDALGTPTG